MSHENIKNKQVLLFILATGVFGILNTEMGFIGILPYIAENYNVTVVPADMTITPKAVTLTVTT